jgi:DNA polymerase III subunit epsilon
MNDQRDLTLSALASRLRLERPLAFLDLETTGVSIETDRIVEFAVLKLMPGGDVMRLSSLVNPGIPVPEGATAVHGISDADVRNASTFAALAPELARFIAGCDVGGFNVAKYDLKLLAAEFARAGLAHSLGEPRIIDVMAIFHRNERRDLTAAVRFYKGRDHEGHRAEADVDATIDVFLAQLDRYPTLPQGFDELADYCNGRQSDWLTADGRVAWRDGAARITFGKHSGKSLQTMLEQEPGYLRWILDKDFPEDLKRLVADAMNGKLPTPTLRA